MRSFVVIPPKPVVTYYQAAARLKLGGGEDEQEDVEGMIAAATSHIDGPDGWLGRAIGLQTIELRMSLLTAGRSICLPYRPIAELKTVTYLDGSNVEHTADLEDFALLGHELVPVDEYWPWIGGSLRREALRIRYVAGYETVPAAIVTAILLMVGDLYRFRETTAVGVAAPVKVPMSTTVEALLNPFRVYG